MLKIMVQLCFAVTCLKANDKSQAQLYLQYIELRKAWEELGKDEQYIKNIKRQIHVRYWYFTCSLFLYKCRDKEVERGV